MLQWLAAVFTVTSAAQLFKDLIIILLFLLSSTVFKEIQFVLMNNIFINNFDHFSFLLMIVFKTDVKINKILISILNINMLNLLMMSQSALIVVLSIKVLFLSALSLLLLLLLLLSLLLLFLLLSASL